MQALAGAQLEELLAQAQALARSSSTLSTLSILSILSSQLSCMGSQLMLRPCSWGSCSP